MAFESPQVRVVGYRWSRRPAVRHNSVRAVGGCRPHNSAISIKHVSGVRSTPPGHPWNAKMVRRNLVVLIHIDHRSPAAIRAWRPNGGGSSEFARSVSPKGLGTINWITFYNHHGLTSGRLDFRTPLCDRPIKSVEGSSIVGPWVGDDPSTVQG